MDAQIEKLIERLPQESAVEFSCFLLFAAMPLSERVAVGNNEKIAAMSGSELSSVKQYKRVNNWLERASLIDAHTWMLERQERSKLRKKDNEKYVEESRKIKDQSLGISRQMLNVAQHLLKSAELVDDVIETGYVTTSDGRKVPTTTTIKMRAKVSDIPRLVETAVKVSRLAADLPTEIIETNDIAQGIDLKNLTDEELIALREKNQRILLEKGAGNTYGPTEDDVIG